mgnify:CR=1 FL=1
MLDAMEPHLRDARSKGIPMMGAGAIYPIPESAVLVDDFQLPDWWPKAYGLDVGWNRTAAIFGAWDRNSDVVYLYSEHYQGQQPPSVHASALRMRGSWLVGAIDPASAGRGQLDGKRLVDEYNAEGLNLVFADNAVEAGIHAVYQRMARGGLKVFKHACRNWLSEFRIYRRDDAGKVIKENDHLMDATRYLVMTGMMHASLAPTFVEEFNARQSVHGRNEGTGY